MSLWQRFFSDRRKLLSPRKRHKKKKQPGMTWKEWTLLIVMAVLAVGMSLWMGHVSRKEPEDKSGKPETPVEQPAEPAEGADPAGAAAPN